MNINDLFLAPYEKNGRGPERFDCFGLFREIAARRGVVVPDRPTPVALRECEAAILAGIDAEGWQPLAAAVPWCAAALRVGPWVAHVATVMEDGVHFIHTTHAHGVTVQRLDSPKWAGRIAGFYRWGARG